MAPRHILPSSLFCALVLAGLAGCSTSMMEPDHIDYKTASKGPKTPSLEVPPDLTQLQADNRYQIPNAGTATASQYNAQTNPATTTGATGSAAAPVQKIAVASTADMHIERDGSQRWLVVPQSPEVLWPQVKEFWQESGFLINIENPKEGVMETDWAENRSKIQSDFIRDTVGKVFDGLWDTGDRDKFRTRLERGANGTTEIYISHRGAEEVLTGSQKETTSWQPRPSDPGLEAQFLARLMARLGHDPSLIKKAAGTTVEQQKHAKLVNSAEGNYVEVDESFDRAWRRVGLALDRVGFTVEDRDRNQGLYFVRYVDENKDQQSDKGFFSKLFSFGGDDTIKASKFRILVKEDASGTKVAVLNNDGKPEISTGGNKILSLLNDQLQ